MRLPEIKLDKVIIKTCFTGFKMSWIIQYAARVYMSLQSVEG